MYESPHKYAVRTYFYLLLMTVCKNSLVKRVNVRVNVKCFAQGQNSQWIYNNNIMIILTFYFRTSLKTTSVTGASCIKMMVMMMMMMMIIQSCINEFETRVDKINVAFTDNVLTFPNGRVPVNPINPTFMSRQHRLQHNWEFFSWTCTKMTNTHVHCIFVYFLTVCTASLQHMHVITVLWWK